MRELLWVGLGGFLGSVARYLTSLGVYRLLGGPRFPYGTLVVNVAGCLLIGLLGALADTRQLFTTDLRLFVFIGVLGGFTTFSSFGYETISLLRDGLFGAAAANVAAQCALGLLAVWSGYRLGQCL